MEFKFKGSHEGFVIVGYPLRVAFLVSVPCGVASGLEFWLRNLSS